MAHWVIGGEQLLPGARCGDHPGTDGVRAESVGSAFSGELARQRNRTSLSAVWATL